MGEEGRDEEKDREGEKWREKGGGRERDADAGTSLQIAILLTGLTVHGN